MADVLPIRALARDALDTPPPEPPAQLSKEAAGYWRDIVAAWVIGPDALPLLVLGLEAWDRYRDAVAILDHHGQVIETERGSLKANPAHAIARDNLDRVRQCFRQLRLEPPERA